MDVLTQFDIHSPTAFQQGTESEEHLALRPASGQWLLRSIHHVILRKKMYETTKKNRNSSLVGFFSPLPSVPAVWINDDDQNKTNEHCTLWRLENPACLDSSTASDAMPLVTEKISLHEFAGDSVASHNLEGGWRVDKSSIP